MNTILKILTGNLFWIIFFLFVATSVQARNEYLNNGTNNCASGEMSLSVEQRTGSDQYNSGTPYENTDEDQWLRLTWRKYLGSACTEEFRAEQEKQMKIKTQLELVKECKRVPRINPPPPAFAELINECIQLGVMSTTSFSDERPDASISYWTVLKDGWKEENPDRPVFEGQ